MLIKELQMHINNPELDEVIKDKMTDVWRATLQESDSKWGKRWTEIAKSMEKLSPEEKERMYESHKWIWSEMENDDKCVKCHEALISYQLMPTYCKGDTV